ncbi:hypothetical protein BC940DRAFT_302151 [Gongronella butleri]|nr:hypothetical protein BC940DRAFT_302151 [Gongronella butleri]
MEPLPSYTYGAPPPSYSDITKATLNDTTSLWPRSFQRRLPRLDVAKFYHSLMARNRRLSPSSLQHDSAYTDDDDDDDSDDSDDGTESDACESFSPCCSPATTHPPSSNWLSSAPTPPAVPLPPHPSNLLSSAAASQGHGYAELNRLLLETWSTSSTVPSYEQFKARVLQRDSLLSPIPNTDYRSSS